MKSFKLLSAVFLLSCANFVLCGEKSTTFRTYRVEARDPILTCFAPAIEICKSDKSKPEQSSRTLVTPKNLSGATVNLKDNPSTALIFRRAPSALELTSNDRCCDNGASSKQNPSTDPNVRFDRGSYNEQQNLLTVELSISGECKATQGQWNDSVTLSCHDTSYHLLRLAQKSVLELLAHNCSNANS